MGNTLIAQKQSQFYSGMLSHAQSCAGTVNNIAVIHSGQKENEEVLLDKLRNPGHMPAHIHY